MICGAVKRDKEKVYHVQPQWNTSMLLGRRPQPRERSNLLILLGIDRSTSTWRSLPLRTALRRLRTRRDHVQQSHETGVTGDERPDH